MPRFLDELFPPGFRPEDRNAGAPSPGADGADGTNTGDPGAGAGPDGAGTPAGPGKPGELKITPEDLVWTSRCRWRTSC